MTAHANNRSAALGVTMRAVGRPVPMAFLVNAGSFLVGRRCLPPVVRVGPCGPSCGDHGRIAGNRETRIDIIPSTTRQPGRRRPTASRRSPRGPGRDCRSDSERCHSRRPGRHAASCPSTQRSGGAASHPRPGSANRPRRAEISNGLEIRSATPSSVQCESSSVTSSSVAAPMTWRAWSSFVGRLEPGRSSWRRQTCPKSQIAPQITVAASRGSNAAKRAAR